MKNISQEIVISASADRIYDAFMDEKKHSTFTGADAKIENKVGGTFKVWDGYATGKNIELIPGKKIVQSWHASDWPEDQTSKITIDLIAQDDKTKLKFDQKNVPDEFAGDVEQGWEDFYWKPLKEYLTKKK